MKTAGYILAIIPHTLESGSSVDMNSAKWYITGALIALLLIAYLIYSLIKPEKF
jgi:K+-transporting ATPase KdpF subunit